MLRYSLNTYYLITFLFCFLLSPIVHSASSVWKVSKNGNYFYLGGTLHLLSINDYPLPKEFLTAFNDSEIIYVETNHDILKSSYNQRRLQTMVHSSNDYLSQVLNDDTHTRLLKYLANNNLRKTDIAHFYPFAIGFLLSELEFEKQGMSKKYGIESFMKLLALQDNKPVKSLESPEESILNFTKMKHVDANALLNDTLDYLENFAKENNQIIQAWRAGRLNSGFILEYSRDMKLSTPLFYDILLTQRNNKWIEILNTLNDDSVVEYVLVGALHMTGKEGLLYKLNQAGFEITQL